MDFIKQSDVFLFIAFSGIVCISGHVIGNTAKRSVEDGELITFIHRSGKQVEEHVTIGDNEVRFDLREKANVFDYEQKLLFFKDLSDDKTNRCFVSKVDMRAMGIPDYEEIRNILQEEREFKMPVAKYPLILQKSENQEQPAMLQLSTELCADSELIVLEPKPVRPGNTKALAKTTTKKPNNGEPGVGWGEVIVIIIVIIILF